MRTSTKFRNSREILLCLTVVPPDAKKSAAISIQIDNPIVDCKVVLLPFTDPASHAHPPAPIHYHNSYHLLQTPQHIAIQFWSAASSTTCNLPSRPPSPTQQCFLFLSAAIFSSSTPGATTTNVLLPCSSSSYDSSSSWILLYAASSQQSTSISLLPPPANSIPSTHPPIHHNITIPAAYTIAPAPPPY